MDVIKRSANDQDIRKNDPELFTILKSYNNKADLDHNEITRRKTQIYNKDINLLNRVDAWRKELFSLKPVNYMFMNSMFLNDNPMFKQIKTLFAIYNRDVEALNGDDFVHPEHLRPKVIEAMLKFMRLVMLTEDRDAQLRTLATAHQWFKQNLDKDEKYDHKRDYDQELQEKINQAKSKPSAELLLPSQKIRHDTRHYRWKARTEYPEMDPPQERLTRYKRRILNFEDGQDDKQAKERAEESAKKQIKYIRPIPAASSLVDDLLQQVNKQQTTEGQNLGPDGQPVTQDAAAAQAQQGDDIGGGDAEGEDEGDDGEPEPDPEDQAGKLDPPIKNYLFPASTYNYKSEVSADNRRLLQAHRQMVELREDKQKVDFMRNWARNKGRMHTEISRKIASVRQGGRGLTMHQSSSTRMATQTDRKLIELAPDQKIEKEYYGFESKIKGTAISEAKKSGAGYLGLTKYEPVKRVQGLSVFDKNRSKTQYHERSPLPFSSILNNYSIEREREDSFDEMEKIKQRFAKYKIPIQMSRIGEGLMPPIDMTRDQLQAIGNVEPDLPSNPFFKVAKKKKKKSKKK